MRRRLFLLGYALPLALALAAPSALFAQLPRGDSLNLILTPERPRANQEVLAEVEDFSTDLNRSTITWSLNGKAAKRGVGLKSFSFTTGKPGGISRLGVSIATPAGDVIAKELRIVPADVELAFEALGYTPPFYRGRALPSFQGDVRVIASPYFVTPDGRRLNAKNLVYTWSENDRVLGNDSGYGKDAIVVAGKVPFRPLAVSVEVASLDKTMLAAGRIDIVPRAPELLLYEDNPLYGILYNRSLEGAAAIAGDEIRIAAAPYFFNTGSTAALRYEWNVNGTRVGGARDRSLVFRKETGAEGEAEVSLSVTNPARLFQGATVALSLSLSSNIRSLFDAAPPRLSQ